MHNTLEAVTYGMPVIFGPNYLKYQEAKDLIKLQGAFTIHDIESLTQILDHLQTNPNELGKASIIAKKYVINNCGATDLIYKKIKLQIGE